MKKYLAITMPLLVFSLVVVSTLSFAAPVLYTFKMTVTSTEYNTSLYNGFQLDVADFFNASMIYDKDTDGHFTDMAGNISTLIDEADNNYFGVQTIAADIPIFDLTRLDSQYVAIPWGWDAGLANNTAYDSFHYGKYTNGLYSIFRENTTDSWGGEFQVWSVCSDGNWARAIHLTFSLLDITSIEEPAPVPEPGTIILLSAGLGGMVVFRRWLFKS